ncbi:MAG: hypothetical protein V7K68_18665 [Nostoc sp.]|uniref:hypothetical protein n=1 Tax=Nostoc sp. TaxID=1180 RepID=UPI002FF56A69
MLQLIAELTGVGIEALPEPRVAEDVMAIAWTVFHPKADKLSADVPSTELFQASASARCSPAGLA